MDNLSGMRQIIQTFLQTFLIPYAFDPVDSSRNKGGFMRISVSTCYLFFYHTIYPSCEAVDVRRKVASRPVSRVAYGQGEHVSQGAYPPVSPVPERQGQAGPAFLSLHEGMERFGVSFCLIRLSLSDPVCIHVQRLIVELERVLPQIPAQSLTSLPPNHELRQFSRQIVLLAGQSISPDDQALSFSQKIVQHLFKTQLQIGREMYVAILDLLCQSFPKVAKEAIDWLLNAEDEVIICFL